MITKNAGNDEVVTARAPRDQALSVLDSKSQTVHREPKASSGVKREKNGSAREITNVDNCVTASPLVDTDTYVFADQILQSMSPMRMASATEADNEHGISGGIVQDKAKVHDSYSREVDVKDKTEELEHVASALDSRVEDLQDSHSASLVGVSLSSEISEEIVAHSALCTLFQCSEIHVKECVSDNLWIDDGVDVGSASLVADTLSSGELQESHARNMVGQMLQRCASCSPVADCMSCISSVETSRGMMLIEIGMERPSEGTLDAHASCNANHESVMPNTGFDYSARHTSAFAPNPRTEY